MKKIFLVAAVAASAVALSSCGSSKNAGYNPSYQQQLAQQQVNPATVKDEVPFAHEREEEISDPWYELQTQATDRLRGAGDAISSIKMVATEMAMTQAAANLATQIEQAASAARRTVLSSYQLNDKVEASAKFGSDTKVLANQLIGINKPLMTKTYRLKDGSYQVGSCIEMLMTIDELKNKLAEVIVEDIYKNHPGMPESDKEKVEQMTEDAINFINN